MPDNVTELKRPLKVALMTMPEREFPEGPFTVTISDAKGKLFEVVFPDYTGNLPEDAAVMGTAGIAECNSLLANLLSGAIRTFIGCK